MKGRSKRFNDGAQGFNRRLVRGVISFFRGLGAVLAINQRCFQGFEFEDAVPKVFVFQEFFIAIAKARRYAAGGDNSSLNVHPRAEVLSVDCRRKTALNSSVDL